MKLFGRDYFKSGKAKKKKTGRDDNDNQTTPAGGNSTDETVNVTEQTDARPEDAAAAEKKKTDERLNVTENSNLFKLWNEYPESVRGKKFDPLEFMYENIEKTHAELKENFFRIHAPEAVFKDFDDNQKEIAEFMKNLSGYAGKVLRTVSKGFDITQEQIETGLLSPVIGNTYSGAVLLGLSAILDVAEPGDKIFATSFGSGAGSDAFSLTVTERI